MIRFHDIAGSLPWTLSAVELPTKRLWHTSASKASPGQHPRTRQRFYNAQNPLL
jgi:hypothetical protein